MASSPIDRGTSWQIKWRQDGQQQSESFDTKEQAALFKVHVEAARNRWPAGWVKGRGFVSAEEMQAEQQSNCTPFLQYANSYILSRQKSGRLGPDQAGKYRQMVRTIAGSLLVAPLLHEQIDDDPELTAAMVRNPTGLQPLLIELVNGYTDDDLAEHAKSVCVEDLDRQAVTAWMTWMQVRGRTWKTIINYHTVLNGILERAAEYDQLISRNPCRSTKMDLGAKTPMRKKVVLEPDEFALLLKCQHPHYADFVELATLTGVRFGELTAARVCDVVKTPFPKLRVEEAWKRDRTPGGGYYRGTPKSQAGVREAALNPRAVEIITKHSKDKLPEALLFTAVMGGRIRNNTFGEEYWKPALQRAHERGLAKRPVFHDLRHTYISWLRSSGVTDDEIFAMVGHSDTSMTRRYGSVTAATAQRATAAINAIWTAR